MKSLLFVSLAVFFVSTMVFSGEPAPVTNPWVQASFRFSPAKVRAGSTTELRISLKPRKGIHIVVQPPIDVKIDTNSSIASAGKVIVPVAADTEHLDTTTPLRVSIALAKNAGTGTVSVKGTLIYYYCSDAEGTCNKFKQPLDLRLKVVR